MLKKKSSWLKNCSRKGLWCMGFLCGVLAMGVYVKRAQLWSGLKNVLFHQVDLSGIEPLKIEHLKIKINDIDLKKIKDKRNQALALGRLVSSDNDFVPAQINHNAKNYSVKLRLKGDMVDHLQGNKWSFRIKCKKGQSFLGMSYFNVQHPATRDYLYEWYYHRLMKAEGVVAPRYEFVRLSLNGEDIGLFALEEHFSSQLIANNQRPAGPIVRLREDRMWEEAPYWKEGVFQNLYESINNIKNDGYLTADIDVFQSSRYEEDETLKAQSLRAMTLLEQFRQGKKKTSEIFDVELMAKYMALSDLTGGLHGIEWPNSRFYFNPVTSRLEPVAFDGQSEGRVIDSLIPTFKNIHTMRPLLWDHIFQDDLFNAQYLKELQRISNETYLSKVFAKLKKEHDQRLVLLNKEFPNYKPKFYIFENNAAYIRKTLNPLKPCVVYGEIVSPKKLRLHLANIQHLPLNLLGVQWNQYWLPIDSKQQRLSGRWELQPLNYQVIDLSLPLEVDRKLSLEDKIVLKLAIPGLKKNWQLKVVPWLLPSHWDELPQQKSNHNEWACLTVDEKTKTITFNQLEIEVDQSMILPASYRVVMPEGVKLSFKNNASLISYSPLSWVGSEKKPIFIEAGPGSQSSIMVFDASQRSLLKHVTFKSLSAPKGSGWQPQAAVVFYESPVEMEHCSFENSRASNALRVLRTRLLMTSCNFAGSHGNELSLNFSQAQLNRVIFTNSSETALHLQGSAVKARELRFFKIRGQAIDSTAKSFFEGHGIQMKDVTVAVSSSDASATRLLGVKAENVKIYGACYQKKSEFDGAHLEIHQAVYSGGEALPLRVEESCELKVNGKDIKKYANDVALMLSRLIEVQP